MTIALAYMAKARFGGWHSYTIHLLQALRLAGHQVNIVRLMANRSANAMDFGGGAQVHRFTLGDLVTRPWDAIIVVALDKHHHAQHADLVTSARCPVFTILHDPAELNDYTRGLGAVVTIRHAAANTMRQAGLEATCILHPYVPATHRPTVARQGRGCSISRVDFDKNTHLIAQANQLLQRPIHIYGALNRLYAHHKLDSAYPGWSDHYMGDFPRAPGAGFLVAQRYTHVVDMSTIAGDGGGTQYTFFEAWDAGCTLVVNRSWLTPGGTLQEGVNCLAVDTHHDLADVLTTERTHPPVDTPPQHNPRRVADQWTAHIATGQPTSLAVATI